jgi:hypothetical protein
VRSSGWRRSACRGGRGWAWRAGWQQRKVREEAQMAEVRRECVGEIEPGERRELAGDGPGELVSGDERLERNPRWSRFGKKAPEIEPSEVQGRHVAAGGVARGERRLGVRLTAWTIGFSWLAPLGSERKK